MSSHSVEVVRIGPIEKHPDADTLSLTTVKGWTCVIKTGQFTEGALAMYVPIDSVLPESIVDNHNLEYLRNGARVKTVKLRGIISQGLLLALPPGKFSEGADVAAKFGITKWEPPAPEYQAKNQPQATKMRPNPHFTRYSDPENIKNYLDIFQDGEEVVITEKIHGTNARFGNVKRVWGAGLWARIKRFFLGRFAKPYEFAVGSRNVHLVGDNPQFYEGNVYHQIAKRYDLANLIPPGVTLYGEIYGDKIQDLAYGKTSGETDVIFFDAKFGDRYLPWDEFASFCAHYLLPVVPVLYRGPYSVELIEQHTPGRSVLAPAQIREGCVIKSTAEVNHPRIGRKILKSISPAYLLRKDGTEFH
jgi:RNA ligase (TIGR02306 family)